MKYSVVIERANTNFSAYVPDLPGCIATGKTREEVELLIREAIEYHIEVMKQDGHPIPVPSSVVEYTKLDI